MSRCSEQQYFMIMGTLRTIWTNALLYRCIRRYMPQLYTQCLVRNSGSRQVMTNWSFQEEELHLVGQRNKGEGLPMKVETRRTQIG
jgi:hypothetical protein